jgi:hypothetical protein
MNARLHETLDEAIDRVAASLTAVPRDAGFGARLQLRVGRSRAGKPLLLTASLVTAVLVAAIALNVGRRHEDGISHGIETAAPIAAAVAPDAADESNPSIVTEPNAVATPTMRASHVVGADDHPDDGTIPALAVPETLAVDNLALHALAISPVELERLDVPTLELADIAGVNEFKE